MDKRKKRLLPSEIEEMKRMEKNLIERLEKEKENEKEDNDENCYTKDDSLEMINRQLSPGVLRKDYEYFDEFMKKVKKEPIEDTSRKDRRERMERMEAQRKREEEHPFGYCRIRFGVNDMEVQVTKCEPNDKKNNVLTPVDSNEKTNLPLPSNNRRYNPHHQ